MFLGFQEVLGRIKSHVVLDFWLLFYLTVCVWVFFFFLVNHFLSESGQIAIQLLFWSVF